ncbi:MAG TPA: DUF4176 domain-containing protein [Sarcina sp.]|nr:protein of unknown function [Sarcina sp. DSM 11001]HAL60346.1 DUF4176 domain-containing protein [Sarcina sp.]
MISRGRFSFRETEEGDENSMTQWSGILPPGSVVMLKGATRRLQIMGLVQANAETKKLYDYCAVPFPEGYAGPNRVIMFQHEDIDRIYAVGHLDEGTYSFLDHAEQRLRDLREGKMTFEEAMRTPWKKGAPNEI